MFNELYVTSHFAFIDASTAGIELQATKYKFRETVDCVYSIKFFVT